MHWSRVKTILIFLFLVLDIFMFGYVMYADYDPYSTNKSEIRDVISIYKSNNLEVSEKIIPKKTGKLGIVELTNLWTDKAKIAELFLKKGYTAEGDGRFVNGNRTLEFYEDVFVYKNTDVKAQESFRIDELLEQMYIYTENKCYSGDTVRQKINDKPVFETALTAEGGEAGISLMSGYWIISEGTSYLQKPPVELKPISGILIDFLSTKAYNKNGDRITAIEIGYSTGAAENDTTHKLVSVLPAYKITAESGGYAVFDATVGELLYETEPDNNTGG